MTPKILFYHLYHQARMKRHFYHSFILCFNTKILQDLSMNLTVTDAPRKQILYSQEMARSASSSSDLILYEKPKLASKATLQAENGRLHEQINQKKHTGQQINELKQEIDRLKEQIQGIRIHLLEQRI